MIQHEQWVWKPPRSMIKSAEASGADKSKLESSAVLRKVQRDFRLMTLDRPGEKPMHLRNWSQVLKKERRHAQYMAELLGKEVAPEKQLEEMRRARRVPDVTRISQTTPGVVYFLILGPFGPRRGRRGVSERQRSRRWRLYETASPRRRRREATSDRFDGHAPRRSSARSCPGTIPSTTSSTPCRRP